MKKKKNRQIRIIFDIVRGWLLVLGLKEGLSAFYLPCKIWGLNFSMLQKIFNIVKFYLCRLYSFFSMLKKCILCSFDWNCFQVFKQKFPKNANCEGFLTKFVNINNYTDYFLHGVVILQGAKNCSQHEEIFAA